MAEECKKRGKQTQEEREQRARDGGKVGMANVYKLHRIKIFVRDVQQRL